MKSLKAINLFATVVMFALSFAGASFVLYKYVNSHKDEEVVEKPLNQIDSIAYKYSLNIDSLKADSTFINLLTKDLTDDDIYTKMISYSDDDVVLRFKDSFKKVLIDSLTNDSSTFLPTDSMRNIMAKADLKEELLQKYLLNNQDKYKLLQEKKGLVKEVTVLQQQIDTIAQKTEKVTSDYRQKDDSLKLVAKEVARLNEEALELKGQNFLELVKKMEAIKPNKAAEIILKMPDEDAVKILKKMNNRQAGRILAALPPSKAARLSVIIMNDKKSDKK